jgi:protein TonB
MPPDRTERREAPASGAAASSTEIRNQYLAELARRIDRGKRYPKASRRRGEQGIVQLHFVVQADGRLTDISVQRSSGSKRLDEAAISAVRRVSPINPIPASLGSDALSISVPIAYRLKS